MKTPNTLIQNHLTKIRVFLKHTGYKQLRYRPDIIDPRSERLMGKLEIVSDGNNIWWEHTTKRHKRVLPPEPTYNKRTKEKENFNKLYRFDLIDDVLREFFTYFAHNIVIESNKKTNENNRARKL